MIANGTRQLPSATLNADNGSTNQFALRDVNNYYGLDAAPLPVDPIPETAERLFEFPKEFDEALRVLRDRSIVVLHGAPRVGKFTTAVRLLSELAQSNRQDPFRPYELELRQFRADWDKARWERLAVEPRSGYLLDMGSEPTETDEAFVADLIKYHKCLAETQSCLVITATGNALKRELDKLHDFAVEVKVPVSAHNIARKRLEVDFDKPERVPWLDAPSVSDCLPPGARPVDAVRMAEAINGAPSDTSKGIAHAVNEFTGWKDELLSWFKGNGGSFIRASLITAALLEPANSKRDICLTAMKLVTRVEGENPIDLNPLRSDDLSTRLNGIELHPHPQGGSKVSLVQRRPGYNKAVLDHIWDERPELHEAFLKWVLDLATDKQTDPSTVRRIAGALTGMSIRSETAVFLEYIKTWVTASSKNIHLAQSMLEQTAIHPVVGPKVRRKLLGWSHIGNPQLAEITAKVCGGELGITMTDVAMTRLLNGLQHRETAVNDAAKRSLVHLAGRDDIRLRTLRTIVGWLKNATAIRAASTAFVTVITDEVLVAKFMYDAASHSVMNQTLSDGWKYLSNRSSDQEFVVDAMAQWTIAANEAGVSPQSTLSILDTALRESINSSLPKQVYLCVHKRLSGESELPSILFDQIIELHQAVGGQP